MSQEKLMKALDRKLNTKLSLLERLTIMLELTGGDPDVAVRVLEWSLFGETPIDIPGVTLTSAVFPGDDVLTMLAQKIAIAPVIDDLTALAGKADRSKIPPRLAASMYPIKVKDMSQ